MPWVHLLRHGIAGEGVDPPLSTEGTDLIRREAEGMKALGLAFDAVHTSPLLRARQTARIVAEVLGIPDRVGALEALGPGASLSGLVEVGSGESILLVGHAPDLGRIAAALAGLDGAIPLGRGALCTLEIDSWPLSPPARLHALLPAGLLSAAAAASV